MKNLQEERAIAAIEFINESRRGNTSIPGPEFQVMVSLVRAQSRKSFFFFAKYILGFNLLTDETHRRWADKHQEDFYKFDYLMRLKPRKTYKTTLYGEAFILWLWIAVSPHLHIFYTSANGLLIEEVSAHLDYYLKGDSLYSYLFGIKRDPDVSPNTSETINITGKDKSLKGSSLIFRTAGGSTNGLHPNIIIIDDPCDKNDRESPAIRKKKENWYESLYPLLHEFKLPDGREIKKLQIISTRWHIQDLLGFIINKNEDEEDLKEKFNVEAEGVYKADGSLSYPEFFTEDAVRKLKGKISDVFFACQYLNNPLPEGLQVFDKEKMHFYTSINLDEGTKYCFFDPSKGKQSSDTPATWWVIKQNGRIYFFDAIDRNTPIADLVKIIARKNKIYGVSEMIYESNGTMLVGESLDIAHKAEEHFIKITDIRHSTNKEERINSAQPEMYSGRVLFDVNYAKKYPEAMNQIFYYPAWGKDDFPDLAEMAISHLLKKQFNFTRIGGDGVMA